MSDDLISRKSLIENLNKGAPEHYTALVNDLIMKEQTAFDKEKVIGELYRYTAEECELHECGIRSEYCNVCMAKKAIEIVEKGGIE